MKQQYSNGLAFLSCSHFLPLLSAVEVPLRCSLLENDLLIPVPSELPKQLHRASPNKLTFQKQLDLLQDPTLLEIMAKLASRFS